MSKPSELSSANCFGKTIIAWIIWGHRFFLSRWVVLTSSFFPPDWGLCQKGFDAIDRDTWINFSFGRQRITRIHHANNRKINTLAIVLQPRESSNTHILLLQYSKSSKYTSYSTSCATTICVFLFFPISRYRWPKRTNINEFHFSSLSCIFRTFRSSTNLRIIGKCSLRFISIFIPMINWNIILL